MKVSCDSSRFFYLSIFLILCITTIYAKKSYSSYSVLRVELDREESHTTLEKLVSLIEADVWFMNRQYAHVMVNTEQSLLIRLYFNTSIHIEDVQKHLDESQAEMSAKHNVNDIFSSYPTFGQVLTWLNEQATSHPDKAQLFVLGTSYDGANIVGLKLGTNTTKRIIYIHCTIHAREWITTTTCLWIIDNLLQTDTNLLYLFQWVIVPVLNVDGYDYSQTTERLWRKNRQLNDNNTCVGTDLDRNYAYGFGGGGSSSDPCSDTYSGTRPFSAPETQSEQKYLESVFTSVVSFIDIHSYGGQFTSPWEYTTELPPDYGKMDDSMKVITDAIKTVNGNSYEYGTTARVIDVAAGGSDDQAYGNGDVIYSFTVQAWGNTFSPSVDTIKPVGSELYAGVKQLAIYLNGLGY
eukprot:TRINITY_DN790_c0_g2_i1.p1 TRINITY_DN790_c0_g2~~TRINITY_DN790_c0_g2_i1.p1  ORF type:complete len:407 (+),score=74.14 TRINITY_DN790_c0_g2_i1:30-1250(+)